MKTERVSQDKKDKMANILFKIDAIKFGVFKLTSGRASPYYVDLRVIPSFPDAYREICDFYAEYISGQVGVKSFDRVTGVPVAGVIFASQVAYNLKKPFLFVRKGVRLHGRQRRVEGVLFSGDRVLLIDDLVTTGLTLKKAADAVRAEGGIVTGAVAFLDREEGAKQLLEKSGVKLYALLNISEIANTLYDIGAIDEESLKTIRRQIRKK